MRIRKAVVTAAGAQQRALPLQAVVDRDGVEKTALQCILEEVLAAGAEEVCLVIAPGDRERFTAAAGPHMNRLHFVVQAEPRGYGHALSLAQAFTGQEPFLHLVGDHLYLSTGVRRCAHQVVEQAQAEHCSVSAVQATREHMLPYYGTVGGRRVPLRTDLYEIETVEEKPTPSIAEQRLLVPGLRAGHYLCFFGIHVFTPTVLELLTSQADQAESGPLTLSPTLARLAERERYLALEVHGRRYDLGVRYGLLIAQLALALDGAEREEVLTLLVELLAQRTSQRRAAEQSP